MLLLEVGFLAIFLAPLWTDPRRVGQHEAPKVVIWLFRWLLFRLMLGSGMVKILSGDPNWANLTALTYHYETQPLPTPLAWYVHQLPLWFHQVSVLGVFFIELIVPFCFLLLRPLRIFGAAMTILLQVLILLTGNYTFFNWLTIALCLLLLDDGLLLRLTPAVIRNCIVENPKPMKRWLRWLYRGFAIVLALFSATIFLSQIGLLRSRPEPIQAVTRHIAPFRIVNTYGLFAVMTTNRPQIIIEGSYDGETWEAYRFRWQSQELDKPPPIVAPHQPRLDWQLWFAGLNHLSNIGWYRPFINRLLEGSPEVLLLLAYRPVSTGQSAGVYPHAVFTITPLPHHSNAVKQAIGGNGSSCATTCRWC